MSGIHSNSSHQSQAHPTPLSISYCQSYTLIKTTPSFFSFFPFKPVRPQSSNLKCIPLFLSFVFTQQKTHAVDHMDTSSMLVVFFTSFLTLLFQLSLSTTVVVDGVSEWKNPIVHVGDSISKC